MPNDFDKYVAYRLATNAQQGRLRTGCSPVFLLIILAALVVIGLATPH